VIVNGLAAILFMIGYPLFGVAMIRTATLPRWSGVLVAVGAPAHLLGFGIAQLVSTAAWSIASLGSMSRQRHCSPRAGDHLRASVRLCRLWRSKYAGEVSRSLRELYETLTEGLATADLLEARDALESLR
jgi:hypothetical protein